MNVGFHMGTHVTCVCVACQLMWLCTTVSVMHVYVHLFVHVWNQLPLLLTYMCVCTCAVMCIDVYVRCVYEYGTFQSPLESSKKFPSKVPLQLLRLLDLCVNYRPHDVTVSTFVSLPTVHSRALPPTSKPAPPGALQSPFWLLHKLKHPACSCLHLYTLKWADSNTQPHSLDSHLGDTHVLGTALGTVPTLECDFCGSGSGTAPG